MVVPWALQLLISLLRNSIAECISLSAWFSTNQATVIPRVPIYGSSSTLGLVLDYLVQSFFHPESHYFCCYRLIAIDTPHSIGHSRVLKWTLVDDYPNL